MARNMDKEAVREYIAEHPNSLTASIAADLGMDSKCVTGYIRRLSDEGVVVGVKIGNSSRNTWRLASWHR